MSVTNKQIVCQTNSNYNDRQVYLTGQSPKVGST